MIAARSVLRCRLLLLDKRKRSLATLNEIAAATKPSAMNLYEPEFEDTRLYPEYPRVNLRLRGYDFVPLEKFQSYTHKLALRYGLTVKDSLAIAPKSQRTLVYKTGTTQVECQTDLFIYERLIELENVPTVTLQLLIEMLQNQLPTGIKLTVKEPDETDVEDRYIPDFALIDSLNELKSLDNPQIRKQLGWE